MPKKINQSDIFTATVNVYSQQGYINTSMSEIAKRVSINETTLFRRFGSKSDLITQALTDLLAKSEIGQVIFSGRLEDDLYNIVIAYKKSNALFGAAVLNLMTELPRHKELRPAAAILNKNTARITGILQQYQQTGELVSGELMILLSQLIAPLMVQATFERSLGLSFDHIFDAKAHVDTFLHGHIGHKQ
ncbi:TetR/AcrR family transcriptional regulator [Shewanella surugensis]|uniref:TetR/AcrR family transcriptional regulator n=1 Tax=Shewanella surugensis TaxID=212020 RepID=A0ABT0LCF6_9GAMM|nr:TetR/AcrR family transcriptional regulator [Shewanella surugensis]MCL1124866.1 TetR/AcrR family transcriptional regulator [Shewanella surugensis]